FGGPGNNYVMHSIATMMDRVRSTPGTKGLVTANGWYITKHAIGLYSTTPTEGPWRREAPSVLQGEIDALPKAPFVAEPSGTGSIETYTVVHARDAMRMGIIIGRDAQGRRFLANTPSDEATLKDLMAKDCLWKCGLTMH
ncbi:MAG: acetyl-CoA acetyltransferase, partial [Pseudomonadota bacterium]